MQSYGQAQIIYIYFNSSKEEGGWIWDDLYSFDLENGNPEQSMVVKSIQSHEAFHYRDTSAKSLIYEHDAMVLEILSSNIPP